MMDYEPKMKAVIDAESTMADAMESMRMSIILMILSRTASERQMQSDDLCIFADAKEAIEADSFIITVNDKRTVIDNLSFAAKWDRSAWFQKMISLIAVLNDNYCWYEDRLGSGFCWQNRAGEFCKLEWK